MVSSVISTGQSSHGKSSHKKGQESSGKSSGKDEKKKGKPDGTSDSYTTVCMTIFVFRGAPDAYYKRHVLIYFTSPDSPEFHETVHVQRENDASPWMVDRVHGQKDWDLTATYLSHVNAGAVLVHSGQEMVPVDIVAATPVEGREQDSGWNCQNFVLEGLQRIMYYGFQTQEWYDSVEEELTSQLLEGAIA
ncbi:hypothetical protein QBC46DRAFT_380046 [Diplogelasinospora grovesii]|uniref:Uncharacterized protein n=1 Tax=Diplogelasinospora grovesii TaxID=303347 RepID=A0AAN6NBI1_9PEZI|nr:hypothetical protein QBC46DRAFT_380046 [Diplogelasinospora grovesii]